MFGLGQITARFTTSEVIDLSEKKDYRPLNASEKKALHTLLELLSSSNLFWLLSDPQEIVECQDTLKDTHPLMFISGAVDDFNTRVLLKKVYDRGQHFWTPFVKKIFDKVKFQEAHFDNIAPHLEDFSSRIGLETKKVTTFLDQKDPYKLFHEIFINYNKI